ncbi:hypothetical protein [Paenibacillus dakarensis]|uniref:hypothetical protein n=1 Tax=Paenibacillus dakarensis TaxID=1527293 RepID=UPI0006D59DF9|nr:hypothetical protein [Paenibacillus dakarensis]
MKIVKKNLASLGKYALIPLCIVLFGVFIYPTIYKFDKLEQKFPVKINRITGETKILTDQGWQDAEDYNNAINEMYNYKMAITEQINAQNENIKDLVLADIQSQLDEVMENIKSTYVYEEDPEQLKLGATKADSFYEKFKKGDPPERVKEVMGTPDSIYEVGPFETWGYGSSTVKFENGKVTGWDNVDGILQIE